MPLIEWVIGISLINCEELDAITVSLDSAVGRRMCREIAFTLAKNLGIEIANFAYF